MSLIHWKTFSLLSTFFFGKRYCATVILTNSFELMVSTLTFNRTSNNNWHLQWMSFSTLNINTAKLMLFMIAVINRWRFLIFSLLYLLMQCVLGWTFTDKIIFAFYSLKKVFCYMFCLSLISENRLNKLWL